jgi:hypothetical protein
LPSSPQVSVDYFYSKVNLLRIITKEYGIKPIFVLQPMIFTKKSLSDNEKNVMNFIVNKDIPRLNYMIEWYKLAKLKFNLDNDFLDLTNVFNNSLESDFIDHGHLGPYSGLMVALPISKRILTLIP